MYGHFYSLLLASASIVPVYCYPGPFAGPSTKVDESLVLHPINLRAYESAIGLQRREQEEDDFSDLDPGTQSQLIYGRPGGMSTLHIVQML